MQTKKAKYHLKRIETILNLHEDQLSRLDRDILLEDIRHLYDLVLNDQEINPVNMKQSEFQRDNTYVAPVEIPIPENSKVEEPVQDDQKTPTAAPSNESHQIQDMKAKEETKISSPPTDQKSDSDHTPTTVTYEESPVRAAEQPNKTVHHESNGSQKMNGNIGTDTISQPQNEDYEDVMVQENIDYPDLFNFPTTSDLSDRLANSKIEHLNKILTINDKILFINHLFSGEAIPFQESLKKFESFYTYEEAKKFASKELVENYNWTDNEKKETVRQFMRQVKRLYN